jgi:hypothetical protein
LLVPRLASRLAIAAISIVVFCLPDKYRRRQD